MIGTHRSLALAALLLVAGETLAMDRQGTPQGAAQNLPPGAERSGGRWASVVEEHGTDTGLRVFDLRTGTGYRLVDFEGVGVTRAHWIGPDRLEVDFSDHARILQVRIPEGDTLPTFQLVTSRFDVPGAGRVDYYSPPLLAWNEGLLTRRPSQDETTID